MTYLNRLLSVSDPFDLHPFILQQRIFNFVYFSFFISRLRYIKKSMNCCVIFRISKISLFDVKFEIRFGFQ